MVYFIHVKSINDTKQRIGGLAYETYKIKTYQV